MLQVFVPNVLSVFSDACCNCVYLVVAYVPRMLHVFYLDVRMVAMVFMCVSGMFFKCFISMF